MDLKSKFEEELKEKGEVHLNSEKIAEMTTPPEKKIAPEDRELNKSSDIPLSERIKNDPTLLAAKGTSTAESMDKELVMAGNVAKEQDKAVLNTLAARPDNIEISALEKHLFLDALIDNTRIVLPFSLFNGRYTGELRSRTQAETFAIFQQLNKELRSGLLESQLRYSMRLRNMLFATQIKRLNDVEYTELKEPLLSVVDGDTITPPAWLDQVQVWENMSEGNVKLLFTELTKFEYKYLTMVESASDQNFWKTELPI